MSGRRNSKPPSRGVAGYGELWEVAVSIARGRIGRRTWLASDAEDLASYGLEKLERASRRTEIRNAEAFLSVVIRNRVVDLAISRDAELARLSLLVDELPVQKMMNGRGEPHEIRRRGSQLRGLSLEVIEKEERDMVLLRAAATIAVMPDAWDRAVLADRFYGDTSMSITELARRHGKSPNVMANWLMSVIGTPEKPGAVAPIATMLGALSLRQANAFVRLLVEHEDNFGMVTDPYAAARSHLELAALRTAQHRRDANEAIPRLIWLKNHMPSSRGRLNKVLRKLAIASYVYICVENDANDDRHDPWGLSDDLAILKAVREAITRHAP